MKVKRRNIIYAIAFIIVTLSVCISCTPEEFEAFKDGYNGKYYSN